MAGEEATRLWALLLIMLGLAERCEYGVRQVCLSARCCLTSLGATPKTTPGGAGDGTWCQGLEFGAVTGILGVGVWCLGSPCLGGKEVHRI